MYGNRLLEAGMVLCTGVFEEAGITLRDVTAGFAIVQDLEKLGWQAPEKGTPAPKNKVRSTTGWRVGGELVYYFNCANGPDYDGPFPQSQNAEYGCRRSNGVKELIIRIMARIQVGEEILVAPYLH